MLLRANWVIIIDVSDHERVDECGLWMNWRVLAYLGLESIHPDVRYGVLLHLYLDVLAEIKTKEQLTP